MSGVSEYAIAVFHNKGDVLAATPIARQLKADEPDCRVTWFTAAAHADVLAENPFVDNVVVLPGDPLALDAEIPQLRQWRAWKRFFTPAAYMNYAARPGASVFDLVRAGAGLEWSVPFEFTLRLRAAEVRQAQRYGARLPAGPKILVETEYFSAQSIWEDDWAFALADGLRAIDPVLVFTAASRPRFLDELADRHPKSVWCREPWRHNAELYNLCDAFVGVSSGISALTYSNWCRRDVPHLEIVKDEHYGGAELHHHEDLISCFSRAAFDAALAELAARLGGPTPPPRPPLPTPAPVTIPRPPRTSVPAALLAEAKRHGQGNDWLVLDSDAEPMQELGARAPGSLDGLVLAHLLQRAPDPAELLRLAARTLRPAGVLLCTAPNPRGVCAQTLGERWPWRSDLPLRRLLAECGFQVFDWRTAASGIPRELPLQALARLAPDAVQQQGEGLLAAVERAGKGEEIIAFARPRARAREAAASTLQPQPVTGR